MPNAKNIPGLRDNFDNKFDYDVACTNIDRVIAEQVKLVDELIMELREESDIHTSVTQRQNVLGALGDEVLSSGWDNTPENLRINWVLALLQVVQA